MKIWRGVGAWLVCCTCGESAVVQYPAARARWRRDHLLRFMDWAEHEVVLGSEMGEWRTVE